MNKIIVVGCNYHTTWQRNSRMRFVLGGIKGKQALLYTRETKKQFWTKIEDLVFIESKHNIIKAKEILTNNLKQIEDLQKNI